MATTIGDGAGNLAAWYVLSNPFVLSAASSSGFTASNAYGSVVVSGSGFTYGSAPNLITGGTITSVGYALSGAGSQGWAGFSISAVAAYNAILAQDRTAFQTLFFGGDDTFIYPQPGAGFGSIPDPSLMGFGGNDVFFIGSWDITHPPYVVDGGSGNDTLNITGGVDHNAVFASPADLNAIPHASNFIVSNVETVNLGAGSNYLILAGSTLVPAGQSLTINASTLGPLNRFIFNTNALGGNNNAGSITLTGGAGSDWFQPGTGTNSFDGGLGTDTIDFANSATAVTVSLYNYPHTFSSGPATGSLLNVENVIGSSQNDNITGSSANNSLTGGAGNDVIDGGIGWDRAIYSGSYASYSITNIGPFQYTVTGSDGSDTLTNVEQLVFADRTLAIGRTPPPFNFTGLFGQQVSDLLWQNDSGQAAIWRMKTTGPGTAIYDQALIGPNPGATWHIKGSGDFDGDGKADILWQNDSGQAQIWFIATPISTPQGPLIVRSSALIGSNPGPEWHVKGSGDFNSDGRTDILWQNDNGQAAIWLMDGPTVVGSATVGSSPGSAWRIKGSGDFDGDGKSDILWQSDSGTATIWYMDGTTVTNSAQVTGGSPGAGYKVAGVGDFDGNLKADILWQNSNTGMANLWLMNGVGPTNTAAWYVGPGWTIKGTADPNNNSRSDILWQSNSGQAVIWMMEGTTVLSQAQIGSNPGTSWQIANYGTVTHKVKNDFDGDRKADLLWQSDTGQSALWFMDGSNFLNGAAIGNNPGASWKVKSSGDFDGDRKADILFQNDNGQVALWLMNGSTVAGGVAISNNPGPSWHVIGTGDFDGDGKSDILWQNDSGQAALWFMNGISMTSGAVLSTNPGSSWHVKGSGDFDGDGKSDILWQNDSGQAVIWLMDGANVISNPLVGPNPGPSWKIKSTGDFDGDGKSDILWQGDNGQAVIWQMNGTTLVGQAAVGTNPGPSWQAVGAVDLDGDSRSDILWQNSSGQAAAWMMSGTTVLATAAVGANPGPGWHLIAAGS